MVAKLGASTVTKASKSLLAFFRREFEEEAKTDFGLLRRVPDSRVSARLDHYESLGGPDKDKFADYSAHVAHNRYAFVAGVPRAHLEMHPFRELQKEWSDARALSTDWGSVKSVPLLRAMVQQYKMDKHRAVSSSVSRKQFDRASSVRSVKATELRRRARLALEPFGYVSTNELGHYVCLQGRRKFRVCLDFGSRRAQMRYVVAMSEFRGVHPLFQFGFESALGVGNGDWDFIVEENVDDVFDLFAEVVTYCLEMPGRIRAATS